VVRTFVWLPVARASYYRVEFYRGRERVFQAFPAGPRIVLPSRWRYQGRVVRIEPGHYRWVVAPGFGERSAGRYGAPIVSSTWVVASDAVGD
jgi:hypothetical protein